MRHGRRIANDPFAMAIVKADVETSLLLSTTKRLAQDYAVDVGAQGSFGFAAGAALYVGSAFLPQSSLDLGLFALSGGSLGLTKTAAKGAVLRGQGIDAVTSSELTISATAAVGNPAAISRGYGTLNSRQAAVLELLSEFGSSAIVHKSFGQRDLAALTAATGDEFAMFSTGGRRLIYRGDAGSVPINPERASQLASQGWRWSSHTHPGFEVGVLRSSPGDQAVLGSMGGNQSAIFNSMGQRGMFTPDGDSLNGWKPW
jgi:hypothetical protein